MWVRITSEDQVQEDTVVAKNIPESLISTNQCDMLSTYILRRSVDIREVKFEMPFTKSIPITSLPDKKKAEIVEEGIWWLHVQS